MRLGIFRGRRPVGSRGGASSLLQDPTAPQFANRPPGPHTSNVAVTTFGAATIVLSLTGDQDRNSAATLSSIGRGELHHRNKVIIDLRSTEKLSDEVINTLIDLIGEARTQGVAIQVSTRRGTHAHDVLELSGILDKVDSADGWLPPFAPGIDRRDREEHLAKIYATLWKAALDRDPRSTSSPPIEAPSEG